MGQVKEIEFHKKAREIVREFSKEVKRELGEALLKLQLGINLSGPISKHMNSVYQGAHELRFRDSSGIQRVFYYLKSSKGILVFHAFNKKTQKTPLSEIETGRKRLKEMLGI